MCQSASLSTKLSVCILKVRSHILPTGMSMPVGLFGWLHSFPMGLMHHYLAREKLRFPCADSQHFLSWIVSNSSSLHV